MRQTPSLPIILVTGASSGVGRALAELFYKQPQYRTVVTARRFSLAHLRKNFEENEHFKIVELDVNDAASRVKCLNTIREVWGDVDILINNAGISYRSVVEHMAEDDELLQMQTNYFGPMALIKDVIKSMREKGRGKIINVSSVSGMLAMPTMASYSASKHALEGASEALWYEMKPFGINVSLIQPGFINSHSFQNVYYSDKSHPDNQQAGGAYSDYYQHMGPFIEKLMKLSWTTTEEVAQKILWVIQTQNPPLWVPATPDAVVFYFLRRIIPRRWLMPILFLFLPKSKQWALRHTLRRDAVGFENREKAKKNAA
jgi:short-subunit dehydrogenase